MFPDDFNYGYDPYLEHFLSYQHYTEEELEQAQRNDLRAIVILFGAIFAACIIAGILNLFHVI